MSLLVFTMRSYQLQAQKHSINFKLYQLRQNLLDLQKYSAAIADGVSLNDLSTAPSAYFGRMMNYMAYSDQVAQRGTSQKFALMQQMGGIPQMGDAGLQQQYNLVLQSNLYEQEREKAEKVETKLLDVEERKINQEIKKLEDQLATIDAEEKTVNSAKDAAIKNSAPKYIA